MGLVRGSDRGHAERMFERFTNRARRVVVLAQEEARDRKHHHVGTEHLLLGLIAEGGGVGARTLRDLGADTETVRSRVLDMIGPAGEPPDQHIPFTPRAKKVMELSLTEALKLGHNYIGTEHLLLGMVAEGEGIAAHVLADLGITGGDARSRVVVLLTGMTGRGDVSPTEPPTESSSGRRSTAVQAALIRAEGLAGDDPIGTHHLLAVLVDMDEAVASKILAAGGFAPAALPVDIASWDVRGTDDEDPIARATRGTSLIHDETDMAVRLDDDALRDRIVAALADGRITEDQVRAAHGRVWAELADAAGNPDNFDPVVDPTNQDPTPDI